MPHGSPSALLAAVVSSLLASSAASDACGRFEDAERASHRPLAWTDFQGLPPAPDVRGSDQNIVVVQIHLSLRIDELTVAVERQPDGSWMARVMAPCVRAYVLKQRSGRLASAGFSWQLAHEQGHFDLAQFFALRLAEQLAGFAAEGANAQDAERALRTALRCAYRALSAEHAEAQRRYDRETNHGHRSAQQTQWTGHIATQLAAIEAPSRRTRNGARY